MTKRKKIIITILVVFLLLILAAGGYAYYVLNQVTGEVLNKEELAANTNLDDTIINIAFFGIDGRDDVQVEGDRTDVIMIGTLDTKDNTVKVTSVMRDTYSKICLDSTNTDAQFYAGDQDGIEWEMAEETTTTDKPLNSEEQQVQKDTTEEEATTNANGDPEQVVVEYENRFDVATYDKINAAYYDGGPQASIKTMNTNFDLNIQDYVTVDFNCLMDVIDAMGGVTLNIPNESVLKWTNEYLQDSNFYGHRNDPDLTQIGEQTLTGAQALAFARNRYSDSDYGRAIRQREVVEAIFNKAESMNAVQALQVLSSVYPYIRTSLSLGELTQYAQKILSTDFKFQGYRIPTNKYGTSGFMDEIWYLFPDTLVDNDIALHKFIYGEDNNYTPSNTVRQISQVIEEKLENDAYNKTYQVGGQEEDNLDQETAENSENPETTETN